jgi:hypothetical protein
MTTHQIINCSIIIRILIWMTTHQFINCFNCSIIIRILIWMTTHQIVNCSIIIRILITIITYPVTIGIFLSTVRFISTIVLKVYYTSIIYYESNSKKTKQKNISYLVRATCFCDNLHRVISKSKDNMVK